MMRIRNLTVSNSRLTEGEYHDFRILKKMELGKDAFFVMRDPLGYKVLMPAGFYKKYGFEPGNTVCCRVDRINCNGRMFLEPMHPYYKEGKAYEFQVLRSGERTNVLGDKEYYIIVKDVYDDVHKVKVFSGELAQQGSVVRCRLERIKKGRFYLSLEDDRPELASFKSGHFYPFKIIGETINAEDKLSYFILQDKRGIKQPLKKKYYTHYGLKTGQVINCKVDKFTSEGYYFLEPENPWYKEGNCYTFQIRELQKLNFYDGSVQDVLVLADPYGEDIKVFIESEQVNSLKTKNIVTVRLLRVRKSRLEVEPI